MRASSSGTGSRRNLALQHQQRAGRSPSASPQTASSGASVRSPRTGTGPRRGRRARPRARARAPARARWPSGSARTACPRPRGRRARTAPRGRRSPTAPRTGARAAPQGGLGLGAVHAAQAQVGGAPESSASQASAAEGRDRSRFQRSPMYSWSAGGSGRARGRRGGGPRPARTPAPAGGLVVAQQRRGLQGEGAERVVQLAVAHDGRFAARPRSCQHERVHTPMRSQDMTPELRASYAAAGACTAATTHLLLGHRRLPADVVPRCTRSTRSCARPTSWWTARTARPSPRPGARRSTGRRTSCARRAPGPRAPIRRWPRWPTPVFATSCRWRSSDVYMRSMRIDCAPVRMASCSELDGYMDGSAGGGRPDHGPAARRRRVGR